jgi:hypothetical protein
LRTPAPGVRRATFIGPASANLHKSGHSADLASMTPMTLLCKNSKIETQRRMIFFGSISKFNSLAR